MRQLNSVFESADLSIVSLWSFKLFQFQFNLKSAKDPKGSYYIKVFGSEISYDDFHGLDLSSIKDRFNYLNWLVEMATEHKFDFTKSIMFLDSIVTIPTIAGMPLKMSVDGVATVDIKVTAQFDLRKLWKAPHSMLLRTDIKPRYVPCCFLP